MQAFKAESSGLRQRLAAEQREVGSLKQSLADRNLAKRQTSQVRCNVKLLSCTLFWVAASHCTTAVTAYPVHSLIICSLSCWVQVCDTSYTWNLLMHDQVVSDQARLLPRPGSQKLMSGFLECIGILYISSTLTLSMQLHHC